MTNRPIIWAAFLCSVLSINLAWEHQELLTSMVHVDEYFSLTVRAPFIYRLLPALLGHLLLGNHGLRTTGLNVPLADYFNVFQLFLDTGCLAGVYLLMAKITRALNPSLERSTCFLISGLAALAVVVFGYFMVPNRALFYPYDFPDLFFAAAIFYLCVIDNTAKWYFLPLIVCIATATKETAVYYSLAYVAFNLGQGDTKRMALVMLSSMLAFLCARFSVLTWAHRIEPGAGSQLEMHIDYTVHQFRNPLFFFALLNICSFMYVPVLMLRHRLDRTDYLIITMVVGWICLMSLVGIFRELRLFAPASLMLYLIVARHLSDLFQARNVAANSP